MKPDYKRRLEALEQRSHSKTVPAGLGHFYSMSDEEKERSMAGFYPTATELEDIRAENEREHY